MPARRGVRRLQRLASSSVCSTVLDIPDSITCKHPSNTRSLTCSTVWRSLTLSQLGLLSFKLFWLSTCRPTCTRLFDFGWDATWTSHFLCCIVSDRSWFHRNDMDLAVSHVMLFPIGVGGTDVASARSGRCCFTKTSSGC